MKTLLRQFKRIMHHPNSDKHNLLFRELFLQYYLSFSLQRISMGYVSQTLSFSRRDLEVTTKSLTEMGAFI